MGSAIRSSNMAVNGIRLNIRAMGDPAAPLLLFLHGFPEHAGAWDEIMPAFADKWHVVAPDQRGYGTSEKPPALEDYRVKHLVRDVLALADALSPGRPIMLVAHDWGASVAYATAIAAPRRIARLVIINGVHPGPFQKALLEDEGQRAASLYMHQLRDPGAEAYFSADNFARLLGMFTRFGTQGWLTPERNAAYLQAWSQPSALTGMLNWYRATPLVVPKPGETADVATAPRLDPAQLRIRMPHLLLWGMRDQALLPVSRATLADYCDALTVREFADADHWIVHQQPDAVTSAIREFLDA